MLASLFQDLEINASAQRAFPITSSQRYRSKPRQPLNILR
jgi:hypothetical protein